MLYAARRGSSSFVDIRLRSGSMTTACLHLSNTFLHKPEDNQTYYWSSDRLPETMSSDFTRSRGRQCSSLRWFHHATLSRFGERQCVPQVAILRIRGRPQCRVSGKYTANLWWIRPALPVSQRTYMYMYNYTCMQCVNEHETRAVQPIADRGMQKLRLQRRKTSFCWSKGQAIHFNDPKKPPRPSLLHWIPKIEYFKLFTVTPNLYV